LKRLIKKILKEDQRERYLNKIINFMRNDFPLFKNMKNYGFYDQLSKYELNYVFSGIFGKPVRYTYADIYDKNGNLLYHEEYNGYWDKKEYDENGNMIYNESSLGYWTKNEYNKNNHKIYSEYSNGKWSKREYDDRGNRIYYERSDGFWEKRQFDENGKLIYSEDSNGYIKDNR